MKTLLQLLILIAIGTVSVLAQQNYFDLDLGELSEEEGVLAEVDDVVYDTYNVQYADGSSYQGTSQQEYQRFIQEHERQQMPNGHSKRQQQGQESKQNTYPRASSSSYGSNVLQPESATANNLPSSYTSQRSGQRGDNEYDSYNGYGSNQRNVTYANKPYQNYKPQINHRNNSINELQDFGVPAPSQLYSGNFHAPTPTTIPGGRVITTQQLQSLVMQGQYGQSNTLIFDVLDGPQHLPGAIPASQGAAAGHFSDNTQQRMGQFLEQVTGGNRNANMVYYCQSVNCWMSYNAALRAINLGYKNVYWYRGGIEAWKQQGLSVQNVNYNTYQY